MKLGRVQQRMLELLRDRGEWYPGCGWLWGSISETRRVMDSLVKNGLVIKTETGRYRLIHNGNEGRLNNA